MSLFKDILKIWKSDSLLLQAWEETFSMLNLCSDVYHKSILNFNTGEKIDEVKALKKKDRIINDYQISVRKKVLTHFSTGENMREITNGLILVDIVVDVERMGDYCKNISDLTIMNQGPFDFGSFSDDVKKIEKEVSSRFSDTIHCIEEQNESLALSQLGNYKKMISNISDKIVEELIVSNHDIESKKSAALSLYVRYLKRIGAHLKNITSSVVNPYERIGYRD